MEHWSPVRDYLYRRMRGTGSAAGENASTARGPDEPAAPFAAAAGTDESVALLRAIKDDVEAVRRAVETRGPEN